MIHAGDVVRIKKGSKSFPFLNRNSTFYVRNVNGTMLRLAGQKTYMASKEFDKVDKDNG